MIALSSAFGELRENHDVRDDIANYRQYFDRAPDHELELALEVGELPLTIIQSMEFEKGLYVPPVEWNDTMPMMNWLSTGEDVRWVKGDLGQVSSYATSGQGWLSAATSMDISADMPVPGEGLYYVVKPTGCGSWQTSPGAQPGRDPELP